MTTPPSIDKLWICRTCGVEQGPVAPATCAICEDERQYVTAEGQAWVRVEELADGQRHTDVQPVEPGLWGISVEPPVGIGQRALLAQTVGGNLLWDVPGFIDDAGIERVRELGGIAAIVASHPHMYGLQLQWSAAFDDAPVYVAAPDEKWLARRGDAIRLWDKEFEVLPGIMLRQPGGHFPGSTVALWTGAADGRGVLLSGDTVAPVPAQGWVSFMRSYPNKIPLSAAVVRRVADAIIELDFDRIYGNFGESVEREAREAVRRSADRYIAWVSGERDADT